MTRSLAAWLVRWRWALVVAVLALVGLGIFQFLSRRSQTGGDDES